MLAHRAERSRLKIAKTWDVGGTKYTEKYIKNTLILHEMEFSFPFLFGILSNLKAM